MPRTPVDTDMIGLNTRIPVELWSAMKKLVIDRRSSLNAEVVAALERHLREAQKNK